MSNTISQETHSPPLRAPLFFVVLNRRSGTGQGQQIQQWLEAKLSARGQSAEFFTPRQGQGISHAAQAAVSRATATEAIVVAVGGDGTINAVCQAVLGTGLRMGVIPGGTFNYFARNVGIPEDPEQAIEVLLKPKLKPVQIGLINDRVFLVNASLGLYPKLLEDREAYKQRYGRSRLVALLSALATLTRAHRRFRLSFSSENAQGNLHSVSILVNNNALQLSQVGIEGADKIEQGRLVAIFAKPHQRLALYGLLLRGLASRLGDAEHIDSFALKQMTVSLGRGRKRVKVATDGEIIWMHSPLVFKIAEHKLPLLVPVKPATGQQT